MSSQPEINSTASAWILEFLLRQPNLDPRIPRHLLSILPVAHRHSRLLKTLLLRSVSDDLSTGSLSESTLDCLESIEELDHAAGIRIPASMPAAYASVAVACTARLLKDEPPQEQGGFVDAVNRIWKGRVSDMETSNCRVGLVSKELAEAKKAVLMAIWKKTKREQFQGRDTMKEAMDLVRIFLDQAWEAMGLPFLERAAGEVFRMKSGQQDSVAGLGPTDSEAAFVEDASKGKRIDQCKAADVAVVATGPATEEDQQVGSPPLRRQDLCDLSARSSMENMVGKPKAAVIAKSGNKYDTLPTPAVAKVQKDLRSSSKDLHTVVEDPLPDALEMASGILADMATRHGETEENQSKADLDAHNASTEKGGDVKNTGDHQDGTSFPGFMAWNKTACTHEWDDDSIECSSDKSPNRSAALKLPSPKKRQISPLNKGDPSRVLKRRKSRKWSPQEEETLRKAVKEFGKGHWKAILTQYRNEFNDRTEIDLKDKWRNMTRG